MLKLGFFLLLTIVYLKSNVHCAGLIEVFEWKQMDYEEKGTTQIGGPNHQHNHQHHHMHNHHNHGKPRARPPTSAARPQSYIPYNNIPMGVSHHDGRLIIAVPRRRLGIPSTLNYIDLKTVGSNRSPKLRAYPDFATNQFRMTPNSNQIISVYRTEIDVCNRLWFIDTGNLELPNNNTQIQRPSIWVIDLKTNKKVARFEIPESIVLSGTGFPSITVDVERTACDKAFAYIPDIYSYGLYVYSLEQNHMWSFSHHFLHFDPTQGHFNVGGQDFEWTDGIFSIALGNKNPDGFRTAYFHPLASSTEFTVSTEVLRNESNAARSSHGQDFKILGSRGLAKQTTTHEFDPETGIIFYAEVMTNGVGCWNTKTTDFSANNHGIVAQDPETMIYPSDVTIDQEGTLWVMTNSMPIWIYSTMDPNIVNFRIWKQNVKDAAANTVCEVQKSNIFHYAYAFVLKEMLKFVFVLILATVCLKIDVHCIGLTEVFEWKQIEYEHLGNFDTQPDSYIPYNNVPMGVNHFNGKLFITVPRRRLGIPSTLNYIDLKTIGLNRSPKLRPYPDMETNQLTDTPDANRIISVYRTEVDVCNRLWFIDTGNLEIPNDKRQIQRPSIWIIDLRTNKRIHRFEVPESVVLSGAGLASITVDVDSSACDAAFAYIPDLVHNALRVYSLEENRMWTFNHNSFHFDPTQNQLNIGGHNFSWNDGIFSITLSNPKRDGFRIAHFHPMASTHEFSVSTRILQNESLAARSDHGEDFKLLGTRGPQKHSTMHEYDPKTGIIFYAEIMKNGVGCWNTMAKGFSASNHGQVATDPDRMIYPSDLTIDKDGTIWVMTNSMPIFIYSQLDTNAVNFRVWKRKVKDAVENTVCEPETHRRRTSSYH
ncbi:uncharacterized protein LOC129914921 [Episyrphus balteatus]|uniref:uncharacterized protein LOC129914921 n=1 Tax=Episyrphus balteatus TaxID=286459 RepID=UPI002486C7E2|nr:uncharacterized protein LOC129914921 [Episyrphus balteatus]